MKKKAMIFAPLPPPVGGIASINGMLKNGMEKNGEVLFVNALGVVDSKLLGIIRPFINTYKICINIFKVKKKGRILFFSSAFTSFIEKLFWSLLVTIFGRSPVIIMVDGNFPRFYDNISQIKKRIINFFIKIQPNLVFGAQSVYWKNYYISIFPNHSIKVVSASVDSIFFDNPRSHNESNNKITLLYIGWIIPEKGIYDLLDAISIVSKNTKIDVTFKLVGPLFGKDAFWQSEIENRNIQHITYFTGPVLSRNSIILEYQNADIFIFPSHYEGFPVSLLEAIAIGLPCIATKVGGIPDILDNGNAGILVESRSPKLLASAILQLIVDEGNRKKIAINAFNRARANYNFENLLKSYSEILNLN